MGQKEPPRLGSTICYGHELARKSHRDSAVQFVTAKSCPERVTKTRQYDLLRPRVGQKKPPRLGRTICYGIELSRKSHRNSTVRFVTAKRGPERATETRQYDLLRHRTICSRPRVGQKEPLRLGSTICSGQTWARKSHQDSAVRICCGQEWARKATKTRQYGLLRTVGQKEPPRLGSTICYGQGKSHQDSAVRFVTAKRGPERAIKTVQKKPPRLGNTICSICYGQTWARKSHPDSAVRFVTAEPGPERATKTRQYGLLRPTVGQKEPPRLGSTICYGQELARKSHQDSAVPFVTAKRGPERATKTRQYDLLRASVAQKKPPRLGSTTCYGQELARKSHRDSAVRFVTAKSWPEKPPRLGSTICYGHELARKSHQDSAVRFVTAKRGWSERATETRQYALLRPRVGQKEPPRLGSTISHGQGKSHQDSAVRFVTAKRGPERAIKTVQKKPPRLGNTICSICYGQELARKSHQDSAVRFVTAKRGPEKATKTRQYDLYGQELARKSHQDSAVRFVTATSWPERATETRQYDLLRPRVVQKESP